MSTIRVEEPPSWTTNFMPPENPTKIPVEIFEEEYMYIAVLLSSILLFVWTFKRQA